MWSPWKVLVFFQRRRFDGVFVAEISFSWAVFFFNFSCRPGVLRIKRILGDETYYDTTAASTRFEIFKRNRRKTRWALIDAKRVSAHFSCRFHSYSCVTTDRTRVRRLRFDPLTDDPPTLKPVY